MGLGVEKLVKEHKKELATEDFIWSLLRGAKRSGPGEVSTAASN